MRYFIYGTVSAVLAELAGHFLPGLLQLPLGWTPSLLDSSIAAYPECCSTPPSDLPKFSHVTPSSMTSPAFVSWPASDSRRWCWPSRLSMELHLSTSKHWSDNTPQQEHFAHLRQLADWYYHRWEETKPAQQSHNHSLFWHLSGETSSRPVSGQRNYSPSSAKDSRLKTQDSSIVVFNEKFYFRYSFSCKTVKYCFDFLL